MTLFGAIENIVGEKRERFDERFEQLATQAATGVQADGATIFRSITQPDAQIQSIVEGVLIFFRGIQTEQDAGLRVSLMEIRDERPVRFIWWVPRDRGPRSSVKDLDDPASAIVRAVRSRSLIVVESIRRATEKGEFKTTHPSRDTEEGSMICYPIVNRRSQDVVMALSVCSDQPHYFSARSEEMYDWVLKKFGNRLALEYSLVGLRALSEGDGTGDESSAGQAD